MTLSAEQKARIDEIVHGSPVVLFMKGSRARPQCGFSGAVVDLLDDYLDDYATVDVLSDPSLRDAIKEYADWPTIPQLYVDGEFVGGADIVKEMDASGELATLLAGKSATKGPRASPLVDEGPVKAPTLTITAAAKSAIAGSREDQDGPYLRLEIGLDYQHGLSFDDREPDDLVVEADGVHFVLDRESARRADGVEIDYLEKDGQAGFKITNPNKGKATATTSIGRPEPELATSAPALVVTDAAAAQFRTAIDEEEGPGPHGVRVVARRMGPTRVEYELDVIPVTERDETAFTLELHGVSFFVDRMSARLLGGAVIDFVDADGRQGFKFKNPITEQGWTDPRATRLERLLDETINPSIAAHGGTVTLLDVSGNAAYIQMGGGCQGCGMAAVTLQQGIRERVKAEIPEIEHLVDVTDHAAGGNPYYKAG